MARFGDGLAVGGDLLRDAETATRQALAPLSGRKPDLACIFVSGEDERAVSEAGERAAALTGATSTIGCSAGGVIGDGRAVEGVGAVAVWCAVLPDVHSRSFHLEALPSGSRMAVVGMPERAPDDAVAILLADPWSFPVDGFVERSNDAMAGLPLVGGLASGQRGRGTTRLFLDGHALDRGAVGAVLGGPVGVGVVVSQGCRPIGPAMTVTGSDGNVVLELAGVAAVGKLEEILRTLDPADQALATTGLQIGVAMDEYVDEHEHGDFLIRGVAGVDDQRGGLVVGDLVPVGRTVRFQLRDAAAADADLRGRLAEFRATSSVDSVEGALLFSCNGRGIATFPRADHDVTIVRDALATQAVSGFFAAGEVGPVGGRNHVHGFTASILAFGSGIGAHRGTLSA